MEYVSIFGAGYIVAYRLDGFVIVELPFAVAYLFDPDYIRTKFGKEVILPGQIIQAVALAPPCIDSAIVISPATKAVKLARDSTANASPPIIQPASHSKPPRGDLFGTSTQYSPQSPIPGPDVQLAASPVKGTALNLAHTPTSESKILLTTKLDEMTAVMARLKGSMGARKRGDKEEKVPKPAPVSIDASKLASSHVLPGLDVPSSRQQALQKLQKRVLALIKEIKRVKQADRVIEAQLSHQAQGVHPRPDSVRTGRAEHAIRGQHSEAIVPVSTVRHSSRSSVRSAVSRCDDALLAEFSRRPLTAPDQLDAALLESLQPSNVDGIRAEDFESLLAKCGISPDGKAIRGKPSEPPLAAISMRLRDHQRKQARSNVTAPFTSIVSPRSGTFGFSARSDLGADVRMRNFIMGKREKKLVK